MFHANKLTTISLSFINTIPLELICLNKKIKVSQKGERLNYDNWHIFNSYPQIHQ